MEGMEMDVTSMIDQRSAVAAELRRLDRAELTTIVRRALENDRVDVDAWDVRRLGYDCTNPVSGGVHRIVGTARDSQRRVSWSLIHKAVRSPAGVTMPNGDVVPRDVPDGPSFFGNWKREPQAYGAGLLDDLPGGVTAPRCFGVSERTDGTIWLWLEEIGNGQEIRWTPERCALAARTLGRFNGAYLSGRPVPVHPCLGGGWLRSWLSVRVALLMEEIRSADAWNHSLVRSVFPQPVIDRVLRLWADRGVFLDGLDRLPHTFCHRDAFRSNLCLSREGDRRERIVAIDWAYAGLGPLGEEIAPLIAAVPASDGPELAPWIVEAPVFEGYLQGLSDAGWRDGAWSVRFGYAASAALRYTFITVAEMLSDARGEGGYASIEQRRGLPIEQVMEHQAALTHFLLGLANEARALLPMVTAARAMSTQRKSMGHNPAGTPAGNH
jgi:hypothetical protein